MNFVFQIPMLFVLKTNQTGNKVCNLWMKEGSHFDSGDAATETRYLNASNRELCAPNEAQLSYDNPHPPPTDTKSLCQSLQFTFQELKSATGNFRPDSILGEGGFGYVFKGWIEEHGTAPAKPGSGITVAVKSLKPDGLQGHREWVVSRISAFLGLVDWCHGVSRLMSERNCCVDG